MQQTLAENTAACHGRLAHKPQRRSTATKSSCGRYVVCKRFTTLKSSMIRGTIWYNGCLLYSIFVSIDYKSSRTRALFNLITLSRVLSAQINTTWLSITIAAWWSYIWTHQSHSVHLTQVCQTDGRGQREVPQSSTSPSVPQMAGGMFPPGRLDVAPVSLLPKTQPETPL